jgi:SAM-dependent methyltransferase
MRRAGATLEADGGHERMQRQSMNPMSGTWPKRLPELTPEQQQIRNDFMKLWHEVLPRRYGAIERFNHRFAVRFAPAFPGCRTLELGAGLGEHLEYEDLEKQEYHCVELRPEMAAEITRRFPSVKAEVGDCQQRLPYPDGHFDRVVIVHVLEHLPDLPAALREVRRVLKPSGRLAVVYPCDPGLAYGLARRISAQRIFEKRYKMSYEWFIRSEHINTPQEIAQELERLFSFEIRRFFPLQIPSVNLNLVIGAVLNPRQEIAA